MRLGLRRIVIFALVLNLLLPWFFVETVLASPGQFDLDIIFVLDNSGSMRAADRHPRYAHIPMGRGAGQLLQPGVRRQAWLSATAANLFIDMASGFDTRVGYVMYTDEIRGERPLSGSGIYSPATRQEIQRSIAAMQYGGFTDIALALNRALDIFQEEPDRSRTPAIVLLSDGDVHFDGEGSDLPDRPLRDAGRAEAVVAAQRAADMGIPIHIVGFDFADPISGEVDPEDEQLLRQIADISNGSFDFAPEAADLPGVMRGIFAALTGADVQTEPLIVITGEPQEHLVHIPHNSIVQASITIMTSRPDALDYIHLYNPAGERLLENEYTRAYDLNGLYTLMTMYNPSMGNYTLRFLGTAGDTVSIDLLSIEDMVLVLNPPTTEIGEAEFSWRLETNAGADIDDPTFIATLAPTLHATNLDTGETYTVTFPMGQMVMTVPLSEGDYEAFLTLPDGRTSNVATFNVTADVIEPCTAISPRISVSMWTILPMFNSQDIRLSDVVSSPPENLPRTATSAPGNWQNYVEFDFSPAAGGGELITLHAISSGSSDLIVTVVNTHGNYVEFVIDLVVRSGMIIIGALVALLVLLILLLIIVLASGKPYLNDPMSKLHIRMSIPMSLIADPPPEYFLSLPRVKGKKTLREIINMNVGIAEPYRLAFERISWFADQAVLTAKSKTLLEIKIPANPAYQLKLDQMARPSAIFDKNGGTEIRIGFHDPVSGYDEYVIELGNVGMGMNPNPPGGFGFDDPFNMGGPRPQGGAPAQNDNFW